MLTQRLFEQLLEDPQLRLLAQQLSSGQKHLTLCGITQSAKAAYLAALQRLVGSPLLYVGSSDPALEDFRQSVAFYHRLISNRGEDVLAVLPSMEPGAYSGLAPHSEVLEERGVAFWKLLHSRVDILLCTPAALLARIPDVESDFSRIPELRAGKEISPEALEGFLQQAGYVRDEPVSTVGSYSTRGGILDFFPPDSEHPLRLEFFGDEIESVREFSLKSQRSIGPVQKAFPVPMREALMDPDLIRSWSERARHQFRREDFEDFADDELARASNGEYFQGLEFLWPILEPFDHSVLDLTARFTVVLDEPGDFKRWAEQWTTRNEQEYAERLSGGHPALPPAQLFFSHDEIIEKLRCQKMVCLDELGASLQPEYVLLTAETKPMRKFHGDIRALAQEVQALSVRGVNLVFVQSALGKAERLHDIFREYDLSCVDDFKSEGNQSSAYIRPGQQHTTIVVGTVFEGFCALNSNLYVFGEGDLFDEVEVLIRPAKDKQKGSSFISDFRDLKPGDYVVHVDHGIGQFQGIREISNEGTNREFMILNYYGDAKLYVPLERLDLIQKHSSGENVRLQLDKLGGTTWAKTKSRIRKSMRDMADELLKLYAERRITSGYSFSPSGHWHKEFEEAFEFVETPDQLTAISDVTRDMEASGPMDRLLCGDVGFGKTEVAMRAAFKACYDGKQVAVLAPTTVLVYQHYLRFKQRFTAFPMSIEMLSRFRSPKEQKDIAAQLATGKIDVIIGTHRMLSKDILFRDLGLLIIDEEQQFGVVHKEKLKQLKKHVDTLTMTATPIPRTLHMSLSGIRDMSIIETPPRDRLSIQTAVVPFNKQVIQSAVQQELARGGQVYFVHNKVESIYSVASMLQKICPTGRIVVGHGQMGEKELEASMMRFVRREADVLVSTTIIENGLDIPLVNTIIINRADRFGLAQLYQLRGRVGRSNRRAYAYLLIPPDKALPGEARQRLTALKEFSDLGSGFKIAALDLELRGAGNLLGGEQHGHINAIGFDLYCQMLERTIDEMRGLEVLPEIQTQINLRTTIKIPQQYIPEEAQRLRTYKRISSIKLDSEVDELRSELEDRYGPIPQEVENLMDYVRLRLVAERILVHSIDKEREGVAIKFHEKTPVHPQKLVEIVASNPGVSLTPGGVLKVQSAALMPGEMFTFLRALLLDLAA